jgi:hypothetical protein
LALSGTSLPACSQEVPFVSPSTHRSFNSFRSAAGD